MLEQLKTYFEQQYKWAEKEKNDPDLKPLDTFFAAVHRCCGAAEFAQDCGYSYNEIEPVYNETVEKLKELLLS